MSAETAKKRKSLKKRLVRLVMLLVVLGLGVGAFYLFALPTLSAGATTTYDSYTALRGTISNSLSFSGNVSVKDNITYTASSAATVRQILVSDGQEVEAGERLMRLSNGAVSYTHLLMRKTSPMCCPYRRMAPMSRSMWKSD